MPNLMIVGVRKDSVLWFSEPQGPLEQYFFRDLGTHTPSFEVKQMGKSARSGSKITIRMEICTGEGKVGDLKGKRPRLVFQTAQRPLQTHQRSLLFFGERGGQGRGPLYKS